MTKPYDEWRKKSECSNDETDCTRVFCQSDFVIPSSLSVRHSSLSSVLLRDGKDGYLPLEGRKQAVIFDLCLV
jgi:hypothetical protein